MVNENKILDKIHLQKYIYLLSLFVSRDIQASEFETLFLKIRREDPYLMNGLFNDKAGTLLGTFFLDVDEFTSDELYDPSDAFNINEVEFRKRAEDVFKKLIEINNSPLNGGVN